jgi:hypothetical protein
VAESSNLFLILELSNHHLDFYHSGIHLSDILNYWFFSCYHHMVNLVFCSFLSKWLLFLQSLFVLVVSFLRLLLHLFFLLLHSGICEIQLNSLNNFLLRLFVSFWSRRILNFKVLSSFCHRLNECYLWL